MNKRKITFFIDLDGCVFEHHNAGIVAQLRMSMSATLKDTLTVLNTLFNDGHIIVLITGRPESYRSMTESMLQAESVPYHQLIMGITGGLRVLVNDDKPGEGWRTCDSVCLPRNSGLSPLLDYL